MIAELELLALAGVVSFVQKLLLSLIDFMDCDSDF